MDDSTIQRYQAGGDIYASLQSQYGTSAADSVAAAAQSGDETQVNAAIVQAKYGAPLNTSTGSILANQLATDPLAAPLASANNVLGNTLLSFLKNPLVLIAVAAGLFFFFGGGELIRGWFKRKAAQ
jgi:putative Ca2+/H+ antiporter (TMEM165/GDT1 family)